MHDFRRVGGKHAVVQLLLNGPVPSFVDMNV